MKKEAIGYYLQEAFYWEDEKEYVLQTFLWERNTNNIRMTFIYFWIVSIYVFTYINNTLSGT